MKKQGADGRRIRASTVEGIFYPQVPAQLRKAVEGLLEGSPAEEAGVRSIIVPHAAFDYSGGVAAAGFKASAGRRVDLAVLLGPVHREPIEAVLLTESQAYQTPLGIVEVEQELSQALEGHGPEFRYDEIPHLEEHCLEVELPFLQVVHPNARLLPLLLGRPSRKLVEKLAEALWELTRDRLESTLFVVSSNLSPFLSDEDSEAYAAEVLERIQNRDWKALVDSPGRKSLYTCGGGCIAAILLLHGRIGGRVTVLERASSLRAGGDPKRVVQYAAVTLSMNES